MEMKFTGEQPTPSTREVVIRHKTEELNWNVSADVIKESTKKDKEFDLFEQINRYWAYCSEATQDAIFEAYRKIHIAFTTFDRIDRLTVALRPLVAELFEYHPLADIDYWVRMKSDMLVPSSIQRVFNPEADTSWTREKTYLEEDYRKLVPLAIAVRIMIPVWEEFMQRTKKEISTVFKEYQAFELLALSNIVESEAMTRLEVFVRDTIPKDRSVDAAVLSGISSEDFPSWVLAVTVVRRLTGADVRGLNADNTLVTYLYNYISQRSSFLETRMGNIKPKHGGDNSREGDHNLSRLEGFKIKQVIPAGDISIVSHYIQHALDQAHGITPNTNLSLLNRLNPDPAFPKMVVDSWKSVQALRSEVLAPSQTTIAAWVLANYVPVRALPYFKKDGVLKLIAFAQAYLWSRGHRELAALVGGISRSYLETSENTIADTKTKMTKENLESFGRIFPYLKRTNSRAKANSKASKSTSMSLTTIDNVVDNITLYQWNLTLPKEWVGALQGNSQMRRYKVPVDIRDLLAALIIELEVKNKDPLKAMESVGI